MLNMPAFSRLAGQATQLPKCELIFKRTLSIENLLIIFLPLVFFFSPCTRALCETSKEITWTQIESKYTVIKYQSKEDLKRFNNSLDYGSQKRSLRRLFSGSEPDTLTDKLISKVDGLYERVGEILDMRKQIPKVAIKIYRGKTQLNEAFYKIYKKDNHFRSWYIYEYNTIYLNVIDFHEGILAHEMAHCIIDHFLLVRPPAASAEILARYVDEHLK
jgi:hypothetical protein